MRAHLPIIDLSSYERKYLSPIQLAEYAGVTRRTIYNHLDKGALRAVKVGGVLRIHVAEARRYLGHPRAIVA